jgi:galactose-1-phosphate uridylyltransferase
MQYRKYTDIQDEIIKTIEIMVNSVLKKKLKTSSRDVTAIILDIKDNKYKVSIDGHDHWLKDGIGLGLTVGMPVWIRIVNGANMYIASRK